MKKQAYKDGDLEKVQQAINKLREARELLKDAGVGRTVVRVRATLSSAMGARRNVGSRQFRAQNPHLYERTTDG
jgi:hypothetical protein